MFGFRCLVTRRAFVAAAALVGAFSTPAAEADPYHHHHYHGGWGGGYYGPGIGISIGGGGGGFNYYSGSSFYGPGLSVYSGPAYPGPIVAPPVYAAPYGYAPYGYGGYGYGYGGAVTSPYVYPTIPNTFERAPPASGSFSPAMADPSQLGQTIGRDPLNIRPTVQTHPKLVKPSTPEAQIRALRLQDIGDQQLRALRYSNAAQAYEKAIEAAQDIPDPYFRLGIAFIGKGRLVEAANTFEEATSLDPQLPTRAPKLDDLLGTENRLSKEQLKETVAQWANNDVRDTRRLFLLGVVMHLDNDPRAREIFESAVKIGGATPGLQAFLNLSNGAVATPGPNLGAPNLAAPVMPRAGTPLPPAPNLGNGGGLPAAPLPGKGVPGTFPQPGPAQPGPAQPILPPAPVPVPGGAQPFEPLTQARPTPSGAAQPATSVELPLPVAPQAAAIPAERQPTPAVVPASGTLPTLPPLAP